MWHRPEVCADLFNPADRFNHRYHYPHVFLNEGELSSSLSIRSALTSAFLRTLHRRVSPSHHRALLGQDLLWSHQQSERVAEWGQYASWGRHRQGEGGGSCPCFFEDIADTFDPGYERDGQKADPVWRQSAVSEDVPVRVSIRSAGASLTPSTGTRAVSSGGTLSWNSSNTTGESSEFSRFARSPRLHR